MVKQLLLSWDQPCSNKALKIQKVFEDCSRSISFIICYYPLLFDMNFTFIHAIPPLPFPSLPFFSHVDLFVTKCFCLYSGICQVKKKKKYIISVYFALPCSIFLYIYVLLLFFYLFITLVSWWRASTLSLSFSFCLSLYSVCRTTSQQLSLALWIYHNSVCNDQHLVTTGHSSSMFLICLDVCMMYWCRYSCR
jgi:hypothetical protein